MKDINIHSAAQMPERTAKALYPRQQQTEHTARGLYPRQQQPVYQGSSRRQDDIHLSAAWHLSFMKSMAAGSGAGFLAALIFLAAAEVLAGITFSNFASGLIAFGAAGWCGVVIYLIRLLRTLLQDSPDRLS